MATGQEMAAGDTVANTAANGMESVTGIAVTGIVTIMAAGGMRSRGGTTQPQRRLTILIHIMMTMMRMLMWTGACGVTDRTIQEPTPILPIVAAIAAAEAPTVTELRGAVSQA